MDFAISVPSASDTALYHRYANEALTSPLLHSFPKEYPAAALAIYMLPLLLPIKYLITFALIAALGTIALVLCSDGLPAHPGWSRRTIIYLLLGTGAVILGRYDVFPALATFLAVDAARRDKWGHAWTWGVLGGLLKLFPFLLLPGFLLAEHARTGRWAIRRAAVACIPVALVACVQSVLSPGSALSPIRYELNRGFELESLSAGLTLLTRPVSCEVEIPVRGLGNPRSPPQRDLHNGTSCNRRRRRGRLALRRTWAPAGGSHKPGRPVRVRPGGQSVLASVPDLAGPVVGLLAAEAQLVGRRSPDDPGVPGAVHRGGVRLGQLLLRNRSGIGPQRCPYRGDGMLGT